jgi:hypothetical protein
VNGTNFGRFSRMNELIFYLTEMALRSPHIPHVLPRCYHTLKIALQAEAAAGIPWITLEDFKKRLVVAGGEEEDADDAMDILRDMGIILHFRNFSLPRIILKPTWLFSVLTNVRLG